MLMSTRATAQKKLAAAALAALLSAGALTAAGEAALAQSQGDGGEVVNREMQVNEDRDYTGLWGLLGLLGLAGLAGLRRKKDDGVDVRHAPSAERGSAVSNSSTTNGDVKGASNGDVKRGTVRDSEVVESTEGRSGADAGDRVSVDRDVSQGQNGSGNTNARRTPSKRQP